MQNQEFICPICNKKFKTQYTLNRHITTARKCGKNKKCEENERLKPNTMELRCAYCNKQYTRKQLLDTHLKSCIIKIQLDHKNEIESLKEKNSEILKSKNLEIEKLHNFHLSEIEKKTIYIRELEIKVAELRGKYEGFNEGVDKPKTVVTNNKNTNTITHNRLQCAIVKTIEPLTDELIRSKIPTYRLKDKQGGLKKLFLNIFTKNTEYGKEQNYASTDRTRNSAFHSLESNDPVRWLVDPNAGQVRKVLDMLIPQTEEQYVKIIDAIYEHVDQDDLSSDNTMLKYADDCKKKYDLSYHGIVNDYGNYREMLTKNMLTYLRKELHINREGRVNYIDRAIIKNACNKNKIGKEKVEEISESDSKSHSETDEDDEENEIFSPLNELSKDPFYGKVTLTPNKNEYDQTYVNVCESTVNNVSILSIEFIREKIRMRYRNQLSKGLNGIMDFVLRCITPALSDFKEGKYEFNYFVRSAHAFRSDSEVKITERSFIEYNPKDIFFEGLNFYCLTSKNDLDEDTYHMLGNWKKDRGGQILHIILDEMQKPVEREYMKMKDYERTKEIEKVYMGIMRDSDYDRNQLFFNLVRNLQDELMKKT
jgi:C2H2 type zinc finger protein